MVTLTSMKRVRLKPNQLLANSLKIAKTASRDSILKSEDLPRFDRQRLLKAQYLTEIIRGWYLLTKSDSGGGSTAWFGGFWAFVKHYLHDRFGDGEYCICAESSLSLHAGDTAIPRQIIIITKKNSNTAIELIHKTSIFLRSDNKNFPKEIDLYNNVTVMPVEHALCKVGPSYYQNHPRNVEIILKLSTLSIPEISRTLLSYGNMASAERIIGAFEYLGEKNKANQILKDLEAVGYTLMPANPFEKYVPQLSGLKFKSPHASRIRLKWNLMREKVLKIIPDEPGLKKNQSKTIDIIWESYKQDAYHSLSIEGYHVTEELISKIESGEWDAENKEDDKKQKDAMAAKGYLNSFKEVISSIEKILKGQDAGKVLENDLQTWYRELFKPALQANLLSADKLMGFRREQVYITGSRHVPPPKNAILDCMETFFEMLIEEKNAGVRSVLGHFIFVYIHPYMDGNGRIGRFIMNLMLVSGGYNWTVIRVDKRAEYMAALEKASSEEDIVPFAKFIKSELLYWRKKNKS